MFEFLDEAQGRTRAENVAITKAMLDLVSSMMLASSLGVGVLLSAVCVFLIQGGLVLLAGLIAPFMTVSAINEMTCAGSLLIVMIGTNLMGITKIKVADFLPAIPFETDKPFPNAFPIAYTSCPSKYAFWKMTLFVLFVLKISLFLILSSAKSKASHPPR